MCEFFNQHMKDKQLPTEAERAPEKVAGEENENQT